MTLNHQSHVCTPPIDHIKMACSSADFRELRLLLWQIQQGVVVLLKISQVDSLNSTIRRGQEFEERSEQAVHGLDIFQRYLSE